MPFAHDSSVADAPSSLSEAYNRRVCGSAPFGRSTQISLNRRKIESETSHTCQPLYAIPPRSLRMRKRLIDLKRNSIMKGG